MIFSPRRLFSLFALLLLTNVPLNAEDDNKPATVAGVRGLNEETAAVDTEARNDAAIDKLDKMTPTPEAVDRFIAEGDLR